MCMSKVKKYLGDFFFKFRYGTIMVLVGLIVALWDLLTKVLTDGQSVTVIDGFLSFFSSHNTGAAWSMLSQHTWVLILISVIFIAVILVANWFFKSKNYFYAVSMGLIVSGALCNLYDRIAYGYVRDFISLDFINFPIFNIADIAITVGVILVCIFFILLAKKEKKEKRDNMAQVAEETKENNGIEEVQESILQTDIINIEQKEEAPKPKTNKQKKEGATKSNKKVKGNKTTTKSKVRTTNKVKNPTSKKVSNENN